MLLGPYVLLRRLVFMLGWLFAWELYIIICTLGSYSNFSFGLILNAWIWRVWTLTFDGEFDNWERIVQQTATYRDVIFFISNCKWGLA